MPTARTHSAFSMEPERVQRRAYSLIELLVVMSIVVLLTGLLLPTLASVRDAANRVISKSNQRNIGQAISLFADSHNELPKSEAILESPIKAGELMRAWTVPEDGFNMKYASWLSKGFDGLGRLFQYQFIDEPEVFYSPGHNGAHRWAEYEQDWQNLRQVWTARVGGHDINPLRAIYTNYHYAGHVYWDPSTGGQRAQQRSFADPYNSVLLSDGMRRSSDLNFEGGLNVLRMDLSVEWLEDWQLVTALPRDGQDAIDSGGHAATIWDIFRRQ
ncbi:MAG: type II secretion system GspH family protein [Phycisphaerales bacterium]|nr:type II secretion system GspH family protein [Phycisphaerales bacterium]